MTRSNERHTSTASSPLVAEAIETYLDHGFKLLPVFGVASRTVNASEPTEQKDSPPDLVCMCSKKENCSSPGKHPMTRSGYKDATDDLDFLLEFFRKHPGANLAIATGRISGIVVFDVDPRNGGNATFEKLGLTEEDLKDVPRVRTGGDGWHYYFRYPSSGMPKASQLGPGIDLKHDGGYILAPPSNHISGGIYHWDASSPLISLDRIPEFPQKLIEMIPKETEATKKTAEKATWFDNVIEKGRRNSTLFRIAYTLVKLGAPDHVVASNVHAHNMLRCKPVMSAKEVMTIVTNSFNYRGGCDFKGTAIPLPSHPEVPEMTPEMLPDVVARYSQDVAHRLGSSIEFAAIPCMCALAAALGTKAAICPKRRDPWTVYPMVWGMIIAPPGTMKSPIANQVFREVHRLEDAAEKLSEINESDLESPSDRRDDNEAGTPLRLPPQLRNITNDPTPEKLIELMAENPHGLLLVMDELYWLFESFEKQSMATLKHVLKTAHSGDMPITQDRIIRGTTRAKNTAISVFGTIQPMLVEKMSKNGLLEKLLVDGFFQRFMLLAHSDAPTNPPFVDQPADRAAFSAFRGLLHQFAFMPGGGCSPYDPLGKRPLKLWFAPEAMERYIGWTAENAIAIARADEPHSREYRHKMRGFVPALALITELADRFGGDIGKEYEVTLQSLEKAILLAEYSAAHAKRLYANSLTHGVQKARLLLEKILDGSAEPPLKVRDIYRMQWRGLKEKKDVVQAIKVLIEYNWVAETKGRPVEKHGAEFLLNPNRP